LSPPDLTAAIRPSAAIASSEAVQLPPEPPTFRLVEAAAAACRTPRHGPLELFALVTGIASLAAAGRAASVPESGAGEEGSRVAAGPPARQRGSSPRAESYAPR